MINDQLKNKIEKLFSEKKYEELIAITDKHIQHNERSPGLACLIGTCIILKKQKTDSDIVSALSYFEEGILKGGNSDNGLSGVVNYINISLKAARRKPSFLPFIKKAEKFYFQTEKHFEKNPQFLSAGKNLFWFQLDNKNLKKVTEQLSLDEKSSISEKSSSLFFQNYFYSYSQKEYTDKVKKNSLLFPKYNVQKKFDQINLEQKKIINIGFVSADFTDQHSTFYFLKNTLEFLDKKKFKIFLFSYNRGNNKLLGQEKIKNLCNEFIDLDKYDNQDSIKIIQEKNIDILFDIMGYSFIERLQIFNSRIAPIQISWLATCNTVGLDNIDYMIADKNLIPLNEEQLYPEKILKLPEIWNAHCGFDHKRESYLSPCESKDYFTFGSFNNFHKISDEVVLSWSKILKQCEKSKLILKSSTFDCNDHILREKFKEFGIEDRVDILSLRNYPHKKDHLNVYKEVDFCLDTFPYNGVTTTFEALWMGVPVLVLKGFNFNSNCGYSIIKNSKFDQLISNNTEEYINKAVYFYKNKNEFLQLRKNLNKTILSTSLFDTKKFSKNFGESLLSIIKY